MADFVFNVAKGAVAEKVRNNPTSLGVLVLKTTTESDANLIDRDSVAAIVANSDEAEAEGYSRKTGITGTVTVDDTSDEVTVDIPDQTWTGVAAGETWTKLIIFVEEDSTDDDRIPLTAHDFSVSTDGSDITAQIPSGGFFTAS